MSEFGEFGNRYKFRRGHPALLSLAKLLLEMEVGEPIPLEISPDCDANANRQSWSDLIAHLDNLNEEGHDENKYLQAVRGCLLVYSEIATALRSGADTQDTLELAIRENLYNSIVRKLVDVFEECRRNSEPRKRQRSESPGSEPIVRRKPRFGDTRGGTGSASIDPATRAPPSSRLNFPTSGGIFDDYTPDAYPSDV